MNEDESISLFFNNKSFVQIDDNKIWAFLVIRLCFTIEKYGLCQSKSKWKKKLNTYMLTLHFQLYMNKWITADKCTVPYIFIEFISISAAALGNLVSDVCGMWYVLSLSDICCYIIRNTCTCTLASVKHVFILITLFSQVIW